MKASIEYEYDYTGDNNDFIIVSVGFQNNGFSIRCLKN
jgi:hypothetical protein